MTTAQFINDHYWSLYVLVLALALIMVAAGKGDGQ